MNRVQNNRAKVWKNKDVECFEVDTGKVSNCNFASTCCSKLV